MYANYQYTLTGEQQSAIQVFLRTLPDESIRRAMGGRDTFDLLHNLTYADSWSKEPLYQNGEVETPSRTMSST